MQNGEYGEIEICPANKGRLEARDISIDLSSDTFSFSKSHDEIARIIAQSEYAPIRFPFQIPRVTDKKSVNITVKFAQKDFAGLNDTINIPLRLIRPDFKIIHQVLDQQRSGALAQGEKTDLLVRVENTGQLDADDVVLSIDFNRKGVLLQGSKQISIGRIEAGKTSEPKSFPINIQRIADPGEFPMQFTVSEKNFGKKYLTLVLHIVSEQAEVITVKGQESVIASSTYQAMHPVIFIATPINGERIASDSILLRGVVKDAKGIQSIEIFVNGRRLDSSGRGIEVSPSNSGGAQQCEFKYSIPLQIGENEITVSAFNLDNLSEKATVKIYQETKKGKIWAAVIGINKYRNSKINLNFARNDAQAFADYLKSNMGLDRNTLFELYDEQATLKEIKSLLGQQLKTKVGKEDTVFIFFAGHGASESDPSSQDSDKFRKYILTHDVEIEDLFSTALAMDSVADIFNRIQAERIIFIIDSCYSGAGGGRTILAHGTRALLSDEFLNRIAQGKGRIILTSSSENEVSQESPQLQHGYFTYYLLEGLKGKADMNGDGIIDVDEISLYLNKVVPQATNQGQHPVKKGETEGQVIIGKVRAKE
jgi:hypothetical protein